ncbi:MAG: S1C family serine protease [Chitinophagales bacterium]
MKYLILLLLWITNISVSASSFNPHIAPPLDLPKLLSGVQYVIIEVSPDKQIVVDRKGDNVIEHFGIYLTSLGIQEVAFRTSEKDELLQRVKSVCDIAWMRLSMTETDEYYSDIKFVFRSCLEQEVSIPIMGVIYKDENELLHMGAALKRIHRHKITYQSHNRLKLLSNKILDTEHVVMQKLVDKTPEFLEGIYEEVFIPFYPNRKRKIAILKNANDKSYDVMYINGASNSDDWQEGELIGEIFPTKDKYHYKEVNWYRFDKKRGTAFITFETDESFALNFKNSKENSLFVKRSIKQILAAQKPSNPIDAAGSGVAISKRGYIITNYHVIKDAKKIEVELHPERIPETYNARIVSQDPKTDVAILQIDDIRFNELPTLPYAFQPSLMDVGEEVFTLGYPLTATMGSEIKLTDGLISSRTGYQGDSNTYQISVPVQPGNSGGPLFDKNGQLVGIIKAKHAHAENAGYAVKAMSTLNLIELSGEHIDLPNKTSLQGLSLTEQVKILSNFVFYIKVYKQ